MWCIGELGLPYQRHDVGHRFGGTDNDEFYALNPNRTIPVLRDGGLPPLWETGAILRYLAHRYAPDEFWPADLIARTHVDRWMEWSTLNVALLSKNSGFKTSLYPRGEYPLTRHARLCGWAGKIRLKTMRAAGGCGIHWARASPSCSVIMARTMDRPSPLAWLLRAASAR